MQTSSRSFENYSKGGELEKIKNKLRKHLGDYAYTTYNVDRSRKAKKGGMLLYKKGGTIHIAENKKGTFTAAATKHGKSVQAFAKQVLANKENYSPAMVKKANFARNASKWKH